MNVTLNSSLRIIVKNLKNLMVNKIPLSCLVKKIFQKYPQIKVQKVLYNKNLIILMNIVDLLLVMTRILLFFQDVKNKVYLCLKIIFVIFVSMARHLLINIKMINVKTLKKLLYNFLAVKNWNFEICFNTQKQVVRIFLFLKSELAIQNNKHIIQRQIVKKNNTKNFFIIIFLVFVKQMKIVKKMKHLMILIVDI